MRYVLVLLLLLAIACSPEATRDRGEPGADPGNRTEVLELHGKSDPAHDTPAIGKAMEEGR